MVNMENGEIIYVTAKIVDDEAEEILWTFTCPKCNRVITKPLKIMVENYKRKMCIGCGTVLEIDNVGFFGD